MKADGYVNPVNIAAKPYIYNILEVTIARKVLPHPQWIKVSMRNLLNKGLFMILLCQDEI
jgi:hypothetical protein